VTGFTQMQKTKYIIACLHIHFFQLLGMI
jgi:hypothetical protein